MNEHIDATIEIVARKVKEMQDLLRGLHELRAGIPAAAERLHAEVPTLRSVALEVARAPKAAMPRVNGKPRPTSGGKGTNKSQQSPGLLLKTCAQLPQPFTAEQCARAMREKDVAKVSSALGYHVRLSKKLVAVTKGASTAPGTYQLAGILTVPKREHLAVRPQGAAPANGSRTWLLDSALKISKNLFHVQFATSDVERVLGVDKKRASNWLTQAELKGWVKRVGVGTYTVAASCPGSTEAERPQREQSRDGSATLENGDDVEVVPTGNANAIAELKHQLAEACKKRDRYRTNENETLMNIEQSRIDRLEGQIAALES